MTDQDPLGRRGRIAKPLTPRFTLRRIAGFSLLGFREGRKTALPEGGVRHSKPGGIQSTNRASLRQAVLGAARAVLLAFWLLPSPRVAAAEPARADTNGPGVQQLRFLDGSLLQGSLRSIATEQGVRWDHAAAKDAIDFLPSNLAWILFPPGEAEPPAAKPTCRLRFANDDEILGTLRSLDAHQIEVETASGDRLRAARSSLRSAIFLPKGFFVRYEGPTGLEGWQQGAPKKAWAYENGSLVGTSIGIIGRELGLKESSSIEFDLGWTGQFNLVLTIYSEITDRLDYLYNRSCYMFFLSPGFVTLQRVQAGAGTVQIGYAQVPQMQQRNPVHIEIRTSKEDAVLTLLVNGQPVQAWKDGQGFVGGGTGMVLYSQMEGSPLRISNIKVTEWDVRLDAEPPDAPALTNDVIHLVNRDQVTGRVDALQEGRLRVETLGAMIRIQLERVSRLFFASGSEAATNPGPWVVRAHFAQGGRMTLDLGQWEEGRLAGRSALFGDVQFATRLVRRLQFNPARSIQNASQPEAGGTEIWDFNE